MRLKFKILILLLLFFIVKKSKAQCDSLNIYNGDFDNVFQLIYQEIDSDSILAVRHCYTTNGCDKTFGLLYWKKDNNNYFRLIKRENGVTKKSERLNKKLENHLNEFYKEQLYTITEEIELNKTLWIDDGPLTIAVFKTDNECWRFSYTAVHGIKDKRVMWLNELWILIK